MYIVPSLTEEKQLSLAFCTLGLPANRRLYANRTEWPIFAEIYHDLYITQNRSSWVAKALYICTVLYTDRPAAAEEEIQIDTDRQIDQQRDLRIAF